MLDILKIQIEIWYKWQRKQMLPEIQLDIHENKFQTKFFVDYLNYLIL